MKYFLLLFSCFFFLASDLYAQVIGGEILKLEELFEKEKYEDCAYKAESYTEKDDYRKNPEPYLYISMCYYQFHLSEDEKITEYYKNALKDALKYAVKMRTYDKDKTFYDANNEYLDELRKACYEDAKKLIDEKNYSKASSYYYKQLQKLDPENMELTFIKGVCDALMRNSSEAYKNMNDAMPVLYQKVNEGNYKADKIMEPALSDAFVNYSKFLTEQSFADSAKSIILFGKQLLPLDKAVDEQYKSLTN